MNENAPTVNAANAELVPRGDYGETLRQIQEAGFCPFCEEHLSQHHDRPIFAKSEHWIATPNFKPYEGTVHHILFITRKHVEKAEDLAPEAWADLLKVFQEIVAKNAIEGGTLMIRSGDTSVTGATVNHLHAHLIVGGERTEDPQPIRAVVGFKK